MRRKLEEDSSAAQIAEEARKKTAKDMETFQVQLEEAQSIIDRLEKSRKKLQAEVILRKHIVLTEIDSE